MVVDNNALLHVFDFDLFGYDVMRYTHIFYQLNYPHYRANGMMIRALQWLCVVITVTWMMPQMEYPLLAQTQKPPQTKQPQTKTQQSNTKQSTPPKEMLSKEIPSPQQDAQEEMLYGGYPVMIPPPLSPDKQWSAGAHTSAPFFDAVSSPAGGVSVGYALLPALHVGMVGSVATHSDTTVGTQYAMALFGRLIFRTPSIKPIAELMLFAGSTRTTDSLGARVSQLGYGLRLNFGAQYFITQHVGIRSTFALFNVQLQTGGTHQFGIFAPTVGVEWFF